MKRENRLRLIDSVGGDVADPYFGGEEEYESCAKHLLAETPVTLCRALKEKGLVTDSEINRVLECLDKEAFGNAGKRGREMGEIQRRSHSACSDD